MIRRAAYPRCPHSGRAPLRWPRRSRRGASALLAVLLLAGLLSAALVNWRAALASERLRGEARHLAEVVAAEGYGLHHWLHASGLNIPEGDPPTALSPAQQASLAAHSATTPWRRSSSDRNRVLLPRGWEIVHLAGRATGADLPDGILVLRPSDDIVNRPGWEMMEQALDVTLEGGSGIAETLAATAPITPAFDPARDRAVLASQSSRLDGTAVLRQRHAGQALPVMKATIDLRGGDLLDAERVTADRGFIDRITGNCAGTAGALCATDVTADDLDVNGTATLAGVEAGTVTSAGNVTGITSLDAKDVEVDTTLTTLNLTACANPEADLCGGGDLDLEDAEGTPDWSEAAIFGDVLIRDGNQLTGITTTTAQTGIFEEIGGTPVPPELTVTDCFRSVTPFVHGSRC